jgi:choline dehydrogenase-like flavoprotein
MILDLAENDPPPDLPEYDLCVVGTGPAGATVASELRASGLRVCVLESGRRKPTAHGDALKDVESRGILVKDWSRERVLGGSSTTWAGLSSPLDPIDLAPRPWIDSPGWPIDPGELARDYEEAAARYRFPSSRDFGADGFGALRAKGDLQPRWKRLEEKVFLACAEPQDFGRECVETWRSSAIDLLLDATVVRLEREEGTAIRSALVRSARGELRVRARAFVLATGGIENCRLLLLSQLGDEHRQVGLHFMNHPKNYFGIVELARPLEHAPYFFGSLHKGFAGYAGLRFPDALQRELGLLDSYIRFEPLFPWSDDEGVESLVALVKRSRGFYGRWKKKHADEVVELRDWSETGDDSDLQNRRRSALGTLPLFGNVLLHSPSVARYAWFRLGKRRPKIRRVRVRNFLEMQPSARNRVSLGGRKDGNGLPVPLVEHDTSELDRRTLVELHRALRDELRANGIGELEGDLERASPWPIDQDASHHMGGTRMGKDPSTSVVDPTLRVHGAENLWIAGSSVFPSSGCANPTYTIVALSIRLARHLRGVLEARKARSGARSA